MSDPIDTRGVLVALGALPNDYDRVIPLFNRLMTALRDGETIVFYGDALSPSGPPSCDWPNAATGER